MHLSTDDTIKTPDLAQEREGSQEPSSLLQRQKTKMAGAEPKGSCSSRKDPQRLRTDPCLQRIKTALCVMACIARDTFVCQARKHKRSAEPLLSIIVWGS